jgi:CheY-like chemotaxis protein
MLLGMARVLIAEPDPDVRLLIGQVIRRMGHEALPFSPAGVATADVALVEPASPQGVAALAALRDAPRQVPIVLASIAEIEPDAAGAAAAWVAKPFTGADLVDALERALAGESLPAAGP